MFKTINLSLLRQNSIRLFRTTSTSKPVPFVKRHKYKLLFLTVPSTSYIGYYNLYLDNIERRKIRIKVQSILRALRSFKYGLKIGADYKWNLWGLDEDSHEYNKHIKECHLRAANIMVKGCIENGGLYVKLGQGVSTMNHILPEEFYLTLRCLQNEALRAEGNDVRN
jgi:aarF domain-containing kinase